jgi:phosphatidylinositol alpha-1,6-mannosyltransferase
MDEMVSNKRLRILLLARVFPPRVGGIENYMYNVYQRLAAQHDVLIITPTEAYCEEFDAVKPFKVIRTPRPPLIRERYHTPLLGMLIYAVREIFRFRPHQIHCDQIDSSYAAKLITTFLHIPYFVYGHGIEITDGNLTNLKEWTLRGASTIIANSHYTRDNLINIFRIHKEKIYVVYLGVDPIRFHHAINPEQVGNKYALQNRKVILTVGRLSASERYKGQDTVIQCLPKILKYIPNAVYLVVGDGDDRHRLEMLVRKHGVNEKVIFAGRVADEELPQYYAACDVFVMLSREVRTRNGGSLGEGFGIVFLEAGACGKPVIGGRTGGIPDAVLDGVTGLLVDPDDHDAAAKAIISILKDENLARRLGSQGCERVRRELTWDDTAKKIAKVIATIHLQAKS